MLALPIFPSSYPLSIVGADELNFCVRDGNRWTLIAINTNFQKRLPLTAPKLYHRKRPLSSVFYRKSDLFFPLSDTAIMVLLLVFEQLIQLSPVLKYPESKRKAD